MARDPQKQSTYAAEEQVFVDSVFNRPVGLPVLRQLMALITATPWWLARRGTRPAPRLIKAAPSAKTSFTRIDTGLTKIAPGMDTVATLCHELAHLIAPGHHGAKFRGAHIEVVRLVGGDAAAERLARSYALLALHVAAYPRATPITRGGLGDFALIVTTAPSPHTERVLERLNKADAAAPIEATGLRFSASRVAFKQGIDVVRLDADRRAHNPDLIIHRIRIGSGYHTNGRRNLLGSIAISTGCAMLWRNYRAGQVAVLRGTPERVAEAVALYKKLNRQAQRDMLATHPKGDVLVWQHAFLRGFAVALESTLESTAPRDPFKEDVPKDDPLYVAAMCGVEAGHRAALRLGLTPSTT